MLEIIFAIVVVPAMIIGPLFLAEIGNKHEAYWPD